MRRYISLLVISVTLLCGSVLTAYAGSLNLINTMTKGQDLLVDVSIKDGDLIQALTTLFNQTEYQVRIGPSVAGTIGDLQFTQQPFEEALQQMLASVNKNFKFEKQEAQFYRVDSDEEYSVKVPSAPMSIKAGNKEKVKELKIISAMLPPLNDDKTVKVADPEGGTPAVEEAFVALITIDYMDLQDVCDALGTIATYLPPLTGVDNGYNNGYNNNNNNNNRYNNNNNRNNNNRNNNNRYNNNNNNGNYNNNNNGNYNNNDGYYNNNNNNNNNLNNRNLR